MHALKVFASHRIKTILHVGDFGLWPGDSGAKYLRKVDRTLADLGQTLYVTEGNHEWYDKLDGITPSIDGLKRVTPRIIFLPRGFRWTWHGWKFLSLGGAPSVDFEYRKRGVSWWPQEAITMGDVYRVREGVEAQGTVDVMITHDAPKGVLAIEESIGENPFGFSERGLKYAAEGRELLHAAWETAQPGLLFHGHYHMRVDEVVQGDGFSSRIIGLDRENHHGNMASLALDDLTVRLLPIRESISVG
jgi:hypothetical protein